jgi:hypothetical protein
MCKLTFFKSLVWAMTLTISLIACKTDDNGETPQELSLVELKNHSVTPAFVKKLSGFESLEVFSLIGSDDVLPQSTDFVFGGSADGAGLIKTTDGFMMLVNHEDNFAVSRITFDNTFKPIKGEYLMNSTGGLWRLCSATMATPEEHGFGPMYLTCGESGEESRTHALNPFDPESNKALTREVGGLGRWNAENAVPLHKNAFPNKTVIIIGDDDDGLYGGQIAMYVSNTVGDLNSGKLYVLKRTDNNQRERDMVVGQTYGVEFVEIPFVSSKSGRQMNELSDLAKAIKFGRVEDVDYRKGSATNNREVYFNVTGQNNTGLNADNSRSKYGRVYRLKMNDTDPTKGSLEVILDGDDRAGVAKDFQNVDNICVTDNYVYTQEDPNSGYNDQTHDAYIYQYNIATKELKKVIELDHRRDQTDSDKYHSVPGTGYPQPVAGKSGFGAWEYGAMIDISETIGIPNTFAICIQPHSWRGIAGTPSARYINPDGGTIRTAENQASQIVIIRGLAR